MLILGPLACAQQQAQGDTVGIMSGSLHPLKGCQGLVKHDCFTLRIMLASGHMLMKCSSLYALATPGNLSSRPLLSSALSPIACGLQLLRISSREVSFRALVPSIQLQHVGCACLAVHQHMKVPVFGINACSEHVVKDVLRPLSKLLWQIVWWRACLHANVSSCWSLGQLTGIHARTRRIHVGRTTQETVSAWC